MKKITFLLLLLMLMAGCQQKSLTEQMDDIDSLIVSEKYDSAYASVMRIDERKLLTQEDSAHYHLLLVQTSLLTHHPDTLNMLDNLVIPYYNKEAKHEKLAEAYYYKAYETMMQGDVPDATLWYKKAEEQAKHSTNYRLHYKIAESLATINEITGNHTLQLDYAHKALDIAKVAQDREWMAYALCRISLAHSLLSHDDSALMFMKMAIPYARYISKVDQPAFLTNAAYTFKKSLPETAKRLLKESLTLKEHSIPMEHLADIYYNEGNKEDAYQLWIKALSINDGNPKDNILHNILDYDMEHGRTNQVCETVNEIIHIKDSMLYSLRNDTIKDLQLRFDHEVAMRQQEKITSNWQKGVLVAVIIVLLLASYIVIRRVVEKIKMQDVQLQINDYMSQINELKASGKESDEQIARLNKQIKDYMESKAPDLLQGCVYYQKIKDNKVKSLTSEGWKRKDEQLFIDYYVAIDYRTVNRLRKTKRKEKLTTHQLFFLLLMEMGKSEKYIAELFGINERSIDTLKTRTKVIE